MCIGGGLALNSIHQVVELMSTDPSPDGPHPDALGEILRVIRAIARDATRMAVEGRSRAPGRPPSWLDHVANIRLAEVSIQPERTTLHLALQELGEAAPELYEQREFWSTIPSPEVTAIDCLVMAIAEIASSNLDSSGFDAGLLDDMARLGRGLNGTYREVRLSRHGGTVVHGVVDRSIVERAADLRRQTPEPRAVRVVGRVDMIRASTASFAIVLEDGTEVRGSLTDDSLGLAELQHFLHRRVLVHGRAIFRPSGRLLRIDAEALEDGEGAPDLWSRVPHPLCGRIAGPSRVSGTAAKLGIDDIFGIWPGDESEKELLEALAAR